jgi:hypothetical protein
MLCVLKTPCFTILSLLVCQFQNQKARAPPWVGEAGLWINHLWPLAYLINASQFMILHASFIFIALPPSQLLKD